MEELLLSVETDFAVLSFVCISRVFSCYIFCLVCNFPKQVREARRAIGVQTSCMRELLYQDRNAGRHLDLRQLRIYSVSRCLLSAS